MKKIHREKLLKSRPSYIEKKEWEGGIVKSFDACGDMLEELIKTDAFNYTDDQRKEFREKVKKNLFGGNEKKFSQEKSKMFKRLTAEAVSSNLFYSSALSKWAEFYFNLKTEDERLSAIKPVEKTVKYLYGIVREYEKKEGL